jgi:DNA polymerase/3'-5' exonuclease PolX
MSKDYKDIIIDNLKVLAKNELINKQPFKVKAYEIVIKQLKEYPYKITSFSDIEYANFKGIGKKIEAKIKEIFETGKLSAARRAKESRPLVLYDQLLEIYGVGPVKAKELIEDFGVTSIDNLKDIIKLYPNLLSKASKIGLDHYYDFKERIPREEMEAHDIILHEFSPKIDNKNFFEIEIAGSYRRGLMTSGDIDVLLTTNKKKKDSKDLKNSLTPKDISAFYSYIDELKEIGYVTDILSLGTNKCLAICKIGDKYRRIDFELTSAEEYYYTLLYFTGSKQFNVAMRSYALKKGWSLNQKGLERINAVGPEPKNINSEKDIFDFLKLKYVKPENRIGSEVIILI